MQSSIAICFFVSTVIEIVHFEQGEVETRLKQKIKILHIRICFIHTHTLLIFLENILYGHSQHMETMIKAKQADDDCISFIFLCFVMSGSFPLGSYRHSTELLFVQPFEERGGCNVRIQL